jgi:hypothetical protein
LDRRCADLRRSRLILTGTQVARSENTPLSVTARKGPGVGSMAMGRSPGHITHSVGATLMWVLQTLSLQSIRTLDAASAEAADSSQLQRDRSILTGQLA